MRNLSEVSPTIYFNVPAGFAALLPFLERDEALARSFFARLRLILYAGAALPQDLWTRLEEVSVRAIGQRVPLTSSWGTTETAPLATAAHFLIEAPARSACRCRASRSSWCRAASKQEMRVRGPNVTPGYWKRPDLTAAAFDEEGFYRPGDAARLIDPSDPAKGIAFDGRLAEDFKLTTGTWVHVGGLRVGALAAASPVLQDAIVAGENRGFVASLAWLNAAGCHALVGAQAPLPELARHPAVREHVARAFARWNAGHRRLLAAHRPRAAADRSAVDRRQRDHRQGLHQPAPGARTPQGRRRAAVRASPDAEVIVVPDL